MTSCGWPRSLRIRLSLHLNDYYAVQLTCVLRSFTSQIAHNPLHACRVDLLYTTFFLRIVSVLLCHCTLCSVAFVDIIKLCIMSTALDATEGIFAVLYVSIMGLTRFYKTTVFLHLYWQINEDSDSDSDFYNSMRFFPTYLIRTRNDCSSVVVRA